MTTLQQFIVQNTFNEGELASLRDLCRTIASKLQHPEDRNATLDRISEDLVRYQHHAELLGFIARNCTAKLDEPLTDEDQKNLRFIATNFYGLKALLPQ